MSSRTIVGLGQDKSWTSLAAVWRQEPSLAYGYDPRYFKKRAGLPRLPRNGWGSLPRSRDAAMISTLLSRCWAAIVSVWLPPRQDPPDTAPRTCPHSTRVGTAFDNASLLSLAEAISRKIARDRAAMGRGRLLDSVVSQDVCHLLSLR